MEMIPSIWTTSMSDEYLSDDEIPDYRLQANNYSSDDDDKVVPYEATVSFHPLDKFN